MPDVSRSDSQRSDTDSTRPRVSFNRDVHVKRIVNDHSGPVLLGALSGDGAGHLVSTPVRRERLGKLTRRQLAQEAAKVLNQADKVDCVTTKETSLPDKFFTLPTRRKHRRGSSPSQEGVNLLRRHSDELTQSPPRKPPRTFATSNKHNSLLNLFKKTEKEEPKKSNLRRSRSDASNLKSNSAEVKVRKRTGSESEEVGHVKSKKTQLSPIIEVVQREDYFSPKQENDSEKSKTINEDKKITTRKKWEKPIKKLNVDEVDSGLFVKNENNKTRKNPPEVVIIDVDKAENISKKPKKLNTSSLKNKLKSLSFRKENKNLQEKPKTKSAVRSNSEKLKPLVESKQLSKNSVNLADIGIEIPKSPRIQEAIKSLEQQSNIPKAPEMIHSSQQPVDKLPLTRGRKVDTLVKRLSNDKSFLPPKTNIMVTPTVTVQHNNNQPFSYTQPRNMSPERSNRAKSPSSPVIYAQVVVGNGDPDNPGPNKQTIHTVYNGKKHLQHSDSDEGLGYEESGFGRKYEQEKSFTRFGDDKTEFYKDVDKFDEEFPITPKFKSVSNYTNGFGYNEYSKTERNMYIDSSARGRGDGMDSRRRESLTEFNHENGKMNGSPSNLNGRSDLSYRRDLLESRINSRIIGEKNTTINRASPDYPANSYSPKFDKYISEKSSRYYRHGSSSPVGYTEKYTLETKTDRTGEKYQKESRTKTKYGDKNDADYNDYNRNRYDNEPKSLDSQASDYRSSPENLNPRKSYFVPKSESPKAFRTIHTNRYKKTEKISKERDHHKSNPEINFAYDDRNRFISETFHDSLRRQKSDDSPKHEEKYFDSIEERKDKFGDSGIENDFRRDSGENVRLTRSGIQSYRGREPSNESEDEGFASSLLIASERQHAEENANTSRKSRREYDSDREVRGYHSKENDYRHQDNVEYKRSARHEYVHRERSIDDGSHFDPRIDKDVDRERTLKRMEKKPPKPAKKTGLEKVKSLFTSSSKKKKEKDEPLRMVREESLRARYTEYKGSSNGLERNASRRDNHSDNSQSYDYSNRRRLSTPSPSPTRETGTLKNERESSSWFKSLDSRLSRKKDKSSSEKEVIEDETVKPSGTKNLRFFGDTDIESNDSVRYKTPLKPSSGLHTPRASSSNRTRSQSTRDLHNISEEFRDTEDRDTIKRNGNYKSMQNISETERDTRSSRSNLKPPASPSRRMESKNREESRNRRRRNEVSSVESSTEGDSSQQSQRSVVYLHAATVGDIPGPSFLSRNSRRAASREELTSVGSSKIQPQVKTLSRSFSMLAPWKPRHPQESHDIDYTNYSSSRLSRSSKTSGKTAKERSNRKLSENRKSNQSLSTLNRRSKSKENISTLNRKNNELPKGSSTTLYKKKERPMKENSRYTRDDKKLSNKSMSVESLSRDKSGKDGNVSRSVSMPRDPEKSAGWFSMTRNNNNKKKNVVSQRL